MSKFCLVFDIGQQQVVTHGHPYLRQDGISTGAEKRFNLQVLLNPFEKQLNLPSGFIDLGDCRCRKLEVIGKKCKSLLPLLIIVSDKPQFFRIEVFRRRSL